MLSILEKQKSSKLKPKEIADTNGVASELTPKSELIPGSELTPEADAERIAELFHRIGRVMRGVKPPRIKSFTKDLTMAQGRCLWAITKRENCTLRELSKHLGVSPSTASELVDPLVRANLVQRETDTQDRRVVRLKLAKKGRQLFAKHKEHHHAHLRLFLDRLTGEQRESMLNALETLNDVIQQVEHTERKD